MQIVPKKQLINTLKELYNLIRVTSGFKYEGIAFNTSTESYIALYENSRVIPGVCRLIAPYDSSECRIICRLPTGTVESFNDTKSIFVISRFYNFINFLKIMPCIKVTSDKYLKHTYYIQLEDL